MKPVRAPIERRANYTPTMPLAQRAFGLRLTMSSIMQVLHALTLLWFYGCGAYLAANHSHHFKEQVAVSRQRSLINIQEVGNNPKNEPLKNFAVHSTNSIQINK